MPVSAVYDVVLPNEILVVAWPSVWIGHDVVGAGVDGGEPAEEAVIRGGGVFAWSPVSRHVERVRHHQLTAMQVGAQYKGDRLHPVDHCTCLRRHLQMSVRKQGHKVNDPGHVLSFSDPMLQCVNRRFIHSHTFLQVCEALLEFINHICNDLQIQD